MTYALLNVLKQERRGPQVVHRAIKEALDLLLVQVHCDQVRQSRLAHHLGEQFRDNAATLSHLALLRVRQVGNDADNGPGRGGLTGVRHYQQLHDVVVDISRG